MSLHYVLLVNHGVYSEQAAFSAYRFAVAVIEKGHRLERVFFYQDGVYNASALVLPANDEFDLVNAWQTLAAKHGILLECCVSAAMRRGVISDQEAAQHALANSNLAEGFVQSGLGALAESLISADKVVQF